MKKKRRMDDSEPTPVLVVDLDGAEDNGSCSDKNKWAVEEIIRWKNAVKAFQDEEARKKQKKEMVAANVTDNLDSDAVMAEALHILHETSYLSDDADNDILQSRKQHCPMCCVDSTEKDPLAFDPEEQMIKQEEEEEEEEEIDPVALSCEEDEMLEDGGEASLTAENYPFALKSVMVKQEWEESLEVEKDPLALKSEDVEVVKHEVSANSEAIGNLYLSQQCPWGDDGVAETENHWPEGLRSADISNGSSLDNEFTLRETPTGHLLVENTVVTADTATCFVSDVDPSTFTYIADYSTTDSRSVSDITAIQSATSYSSNDLSPVVRMPKTTSAAYATTDLSSKSVSCVDIITVDEDNDSDDVVVLEPSSACDNSSITSDAFSGTSDVKEELQEFLSFAQTSDADVQCHEEVQPTAVQIVQCAWCGLECLEGPETHFVAVKQCKEKSVLMKKWVKRATLCRVCFEPLRGLENHHNHYATRVKCRIHCMRIIQKMWEHKRRNFRDNSLVSVDSTSSSPAAGSPAVGNVTVSSACNTSITASSGSPVTPPIADSCHQVLLLHPVLFV